MFQLHGNKHLLDQLGNFTLLRVLDLEGCEGIENKHVRYACQLHLLKFLSFKDTTIREVPCQISNLENLQTLDLRGTELAKRLPTTVTELEKLERLHTSTLWYLPEGLSSMKALREVALAVLDNVKVAWELGKLEQLQELSIHVDTTKIRHDDAEGKEAFVQEVANSLSKLYSLRSLNITGEDTGKLKCLHRLQEPPRLLRHLRIGGAMGCHQLPSWVGSLTYLVEIILTDVGNLRDDEPFGVLCKLPSLQSIRMENQCYSGEELVARTGHNFLALVNLAMSFWYDEPQAFRFEAGSMPKLEKLTFSFVPDGKTRVITGIEHLTRLKEVQLSGNETNGALNRAVEQFKAESGRREAGSSQFQVIVKKW
jgi:disease resistance protein RPM1